MYLRLSFFSYPRCHCYTSPEFIFFFPDSHINANLHSTLNKKISANRAKRVLYHFWCTVLALNTECCADLLEIPILPLHLTPDLVQKRQSCFPFLLHSYIHLSVDLLLFSHKKNKKIQILEQKAVDLFLRCVSIRSAD